MNSMYRHASKLSAAIAGTALALCLGLTACTSGSATGSAENAKVITVNASSEVKAVPDLASITVVITTEGNSAKAAQKANGKPTKAVIAKLKELGVPDKEIQTSYTDLSPVWDDEGNEGDAYEMRTVLDVGGLPVADVNTIMDACVDAGATEVNGPQYYLSTFDETYQEALTAAIEESRPKAEALAKASGVKLGKVVSVTEGYEDDSYSYAMFDYADEERAEDAEGTAPLEPGEISIRAEITVSYAIN